MEVGFEEGQDFASQGLVWFAFQGVAEIAERCFGPAEEITHCEAIHLHRGCGSPIPSFQGLFQTGELLGAGVRTDEIKGSGAQNFQTEWGSSGATHCCRYR